MTYREFLFAFAGLDQVLPGMADLTRGLEEGGMSPAAIVSGLFGSIERGYVESIEDLGSTTRFVLTPLAAQKMELCLSGNSRRWVSRRKPWIPVRAKGLIGASRSRRRSTQDPKDYEVLALLLDPKQPDPVWLMIAREEEAAKRGYDADNLPVIRQFLGHNAIWPIPECDDGKCLACGGKKLALDAYCLKCDNAGAEKFLPKVAKPRRRQMPRSKSALKGGVG